MLDAESSVLFQRLPILPLRVRIKLEAIKQNKFFDPVEEAIYN